MNKNLILKYIINIVAVFTIGLLFRWFINTNDFFVLRSLIFTYVLGIFPYIFNIFYFTITSFDLDVLQELLKNKFIIPTICNADNINNPIN